MRKRRHSAGGRTGPDPIKIGQHTIAVRVSWDGMFTADWEAETHKSTTYSGLRAKLLPLVRGDLKRCHVAAFFRGYGAGWKFITLIGIHAGNDNVLYVDADGETHQESAHSPRVFRVLSKDELAQCAKLEADIKAAETRLSLWLKRRAIHAGNTVRKAIGMPIEPPKTRDTEDYN